MKHLFTIHSPITFLCAVSTCEYLNLDEKDVIIISANYKVPFSYGRIVNAYQDLHKGLFNKIIHFDQPKAYDDYINSLTENEPYTAYIDLMHYWQRLLITNELCASFNFIEEGTASYMKPNDVLQLTSMIKRDSFRTVGYKNYFNDLYFALRGYNQKLLNLPYWPFSYRFVESTSYYCFSKDCYPGVEVDKKHIVSFKEAYNSREVSNAIIWIEESFNKQFVKNKDSIDFALSYSIQYIQNKFGDGRSHFIKLRPGMKENESEVVPHLQKNGIPFEILESNEPLELSLSISKNIIIVGAISSLLYYASIMGHNAQSYFDLLREKKKSGFDELRFYWGKVNKIKYFQ